MLEGRTIVVTGAARGVGRAIAFACARHGARLVLGDVLSELGRDAGAEIAATGAIVRYVVEWASPSQLQGKISRDTLKAGDHIIITGNPARNADDHRLRLVTLRRPKDGWSWGLASDEVISR